MHLVCQEVAFSISLSADMPLKELLVI